MSLWNRIEGFIFGGAVARAGSESVTPVLEPVRQKAWLRNRVRVLDTGAVAELVAKGFGTVDELADEAARHGYSAVRLEALAALAQSYPGLSELDTFSNRRLLDPGLIDKALSRHGIPAEYHAAIKASFSEILTPGELAAAIHRGLVPDPVNPTTGEPLLKGEQPEPPFKVEAYPVYPIDTATEAAGSGYDLDRLGVLVGLQGLPMGVIEAAHAFYRGIITHGDYIRAFNESNSRNEWARAVLDYARQIPTARDFIENWLRGYSTPEEAKAGAALHGMSPEHAQIIFENSGRAMNLRQITQALAWGAKYNPAPTDDPDPYRQSTLVGPLRPEYYELNEANKFNLPSALYFRTLQQQKVLTPDEAFTWYKRLAWPPELARQVADAYGKTKATAAKEATAADQLALYEGRKQSRDETLAALEALDYPPDEAAAKLDTLDARRVASARGQAITDLHSAFKTGKLDAAATEAALAKLVNEPETAPLIVAAWQAYKDALPTTTPTA